MNWNFPDLKVISGECELVSESCILTRVCEDCWGVPASLATTVIQQGALESRTHSRQTPSSAVRRRRSQLSGDLVFRTPVSGSSSKCVRKVTSSSRLRSGMVTIRFERELASFKGKL